VLVLVMLAGTDTTVADSDGSVDLESNEHRMVDYFRPGETRTEPYRVENRGDLEDSYNASLTLSNPLWKGQLDRYHFQNVTPGETIIFNVTITAPWFPSGNYTDINLTVRSMGSLEEEYLAWREYMFWQRALDISYDGPSSKNLSEDLEITWDVTVSNTGDYPNDVNLSARVFEGDVEIEGGYQVEMSTWEVHLERNESTSVFILFFVTDLSRFNTDTGYTLFLVGKDLNEREVTDGERLKWRVPLLYQVEAIQQWDSFEVIPGTSDQVKVSLYQTTTDRWGHIWDAFIDGDVGEWMVEFDRSSVKLVGTDNAVFELTVMGPDNAKAGTRLDIQVRFECVRRPDDVLEAGFHFTVAEHRNITMHTSASTFKVIPPMSVTIKVTLANRGNVAEGFHFALETRYPELSRYQPFGNNTLSSTIHPGERRKLEYTFPFDMTMQGGKYTFAMECWLEEGRLLFQVIEVELPVRRTVDIVGLPLDRVDINPNLDPVELPFLLRNTGNMDLVLRVDWEDSRSGSGPDVLIKELDYPFMVDLAKDQECSLTLVLMASKSTPFDSGMLRLTVTDSGHHDTWARDVLYTIVGPGLVIDEVVRSEIVVKGEQTTVKVKISNVGSGDSPAMLLILTETFEGRPIEEIIVPPIMAHTSTEVSITYTPSLGQERLYVVLDPDDNVRETDNERNLAGFEVSVVEAPIWGPSMMAVSVAAVLLTAVAMIMWRRRKSRRTGT
jgi:hypothetical protein